MTNLKAQAELYVDEHYKFGAKEAELAEFMDHARRVREVQTALAAKHSDGTAARVFHAKSHGCLAGRLTLIDERPEFTRHGLFGAASTAYNVIARFSNGVGLEQHDLKPDVRGLAFKVFGVRGSSAAISDQKPRTVDLLMTNSTNPFGSDQEEFVQFMEANAKPGVLNAHLIGFLSAHTDVARLLIKATLKFVPSVATERYWSGHAYLLGPQQAMKFNVRPIEQKRSESDEELLKETAKLAQISDAPGDGLESRVKRWLQMRTVTNSVIDPNYLGFELRDRLRRTPIKFVLSVQLAKDAQRTPIENGLMEWKEADSPSVPVAELTLDREIDTGDIRNLRFTPGHFIPEHRPLGNLGRGRVFAYESSQMGRHADIDEPDENRFFAS